MICECTDCKHCADFDHGFRVFCLEPYLPSDEVCKYHPIGHHDAENCDGFEEDEPHRFSMKEFNEVEKYGEAKYGEVTYDSVREWCLLQITPAPDMKG